MTARAPTRNLPPRPKRTHESRPKRSKSALKSVLAESSVLKVDRFRFPSFEPNKHWRILLDWAALIEDEAAAGIVICEQAFAGRSVSAPTCAHAEIANRLERQALNSCAAVEIPKKSLQQSGKELAGSNSDSYATDVETFDAG